MSMRYGKIFVTRITFTVCFASALKDVINRDRIERERNAAITRRTAGREIKAPDKYDPSEETKKKGAAAELKAVQVSTADFPPVNAAVSHFFWSFADFILFVPRIILLLFVRDFLLPALRILNQIWQLGAKVHTVYRTVHVKNVGTRIIYAACESTNCNKPEM